MKLLQTLSVTTLLLLVMSCGPLKTLPVVTTVEEQPSKPIAKAFNQELIIDIKGDSVSGYAFIAENDLPKETIILVAGYPGNDNNFDLAQAIRRSGKNVVHFNHRGAWGSQGTYSYSSCLEDVKEVIDYLSQAEVAERLRIKPDVFTLLGRSFGGGIALISGSKLVGVKKIIAISSVNYGELMLRYNELEDLEGFRKYMRKQVMMNHDIEAFLQELLDNKTKFNILTYQNELKIKEVLIIEDSDKNQSWISKLENIESVWMDTDHNFIDKRPELTDLIISWIHKE